VLKPSSIPRIAKIIFYNNVNIFVTEANRRRESGTREKVSSRRINLEGNTHAQESNASQLPV
jgi:hypothetical protein